MLCDADQTIALRRMMLFHVQAFLKIPLIIPDIGQKGKGCIIPDGPHAIQ